MSVINVPVYLTEAGVQQNPAVPAFISTNCDGGELGILNKKYVEVYIHWNGAAWVEDPVWIPGQSIVALKIFNLCTDAISYINYPLSDYRIAQLCCRDEQGDLGFFEPQFESQFE